MYELQPYLVELFVAQSMPFIIHILLMHFHCSGKLTFLQTNEKYTRIKSQRKPKYKKKQKKIGIIDGSFSTSDELYKIAY